MYIGKIFGIHTHRVDSPVFIINKLIGAVVHQDSNQVLASEAFGAVDAGHKDPENKVIVLQRHVFVPDSITDLEFGAVRSVVKSLNLDPFLSHLYIKDVTLMENGNAVLRYAVHTYGE